jgi:hypothetical protein
MPLTGDTPEKMPGCNLYPLLYHSDSLRHSSLTADVPGPCPDNFLPLLVEMMLIPAKGVIIITQCLEMPHVRSSQQPMASFDNALPIMAGRLILMVSGNNTANNCPQNILSQDNA